MSWAGGGSTRQSRRERDQVLQAWPRCYLGYPGCTIISTEDDHVIPTAEGGSNELWNRRGACSACHAVKSKAESARGRARARARTQRPTSKHPGLI